MATVYNVIFLFLVKTVKIFVSFIGIAKIALEGPFFGIHP